MGTLTLAFTFSLEKQIGGLLLITLSWGPSEPTKIWFFLSSFFIFWANLVSGILDYGHNNVSTVNNENEIYYKINEIAKADDVIIFLGAGNITQFSDTIISKINNLEVKNG